MTKKSLNLYGQTRNERGRKTFGGASIEAVSASRAEEEARVRRVASEEGFVFSGSYPDLLKHVMRKAEAKTDSGLSA